MESAVVMFSMVILIFVGSAVPALSCDMTCMGNMTPPATGSTPSPEEMQQMCSKYPDIVKCLEKAVPQCTDELKKSSLEKMLEGAKASQENCAKMTGCKTEVMKCNLSTALYNSTEEATKDECVQIGNAVECMKKLDCKMMEEMIAEKLKETEELKKEKCTDGSAFLYPSILSIALAILLAFLGQKW